MEGKYNDLYAAAVSRAEADWLVGINATRALTCKYNAQLSCGRVQTPTLAMIAKREEEIRTFQPTGILWCDVQAGKIQVDMARSKVGKLSFVFKRANRTAGREFEWGAIHGRRTSGKICEEIICAGII